jgi:hypothetical protein
MTLLSDVPRKDLFLETACRKTVCGTLDFEDSFAPVPAAGFPSP